ncbi:TPA: hypothetical protein SIA35_003233 [Aeromonas sobria]|nr:hypothetical protein [Aeromonas sobria]
MKGVITGARLIHEEIPDDTQQMADTTSFGLEKASEIAAITTGRKACGSLFNNRGVAIQGGNYLKVGCGGQI